jgi:hypothetical protein
VLADLRNYLPPFVCDSFKHAIPAFARRLNGFYFSDAVLTGGETRSPSPVRLARVKDLQSSISGLFSASEGGGMPAASWHQR